MKPKNDMKNSYPGSEKIYVPGKLYNIQVGMRKVNLTDTVKIIDGKRITRHNDPVYIYDTSGAYTDPKIEIDLKKLGLNCQEKADLMVSHINSQSKENLKAKSPLEMMEFLNSELYKRFIEYGIEKIERDQIVLKPYLLKDKK